MRRYTLKETKETEKIFCNGCGKEISVKDGMAREDFLSVEKRWGYFSEKDNEIHRFDLCDECYDRMISGFTIPAERENSEQS